MLPHIGLNASLSHINAKKGHIALVSQSAGLCTTILDWANNKDIGFSAMLSLGDGCDIELHELLDFLGRDSHTHAIMLCIDHINDSQRFVSAARAAARYKPILVLKSGGPNAAVAQQDNDIVYDAVFRRAGMLRVDDLVDLFAAVETLAHAKSIAGEK